MEDDAHASSWQSTFQNAWLLALGIMTCHWRESTSSEVWPCIWHALKRDHSPDSFSLQDFCHNPEPSFCLCQWPEWPLAFSIGGRCWCIMTCLSLSTYLAFSFGGWCWCIMTFLSLSIDWVLRCLVWKMTAVKRLRTEVCECAKCKLPLWKLMLLGIDVFDFENYWSRSLSWTICALSEKLARLSNLLSPEILGWVEWKTDHECQSWPIIFVLQWEMGMSGICFSAYELRAWICMKVSGGVPTQARLSGKSQKWQGQHLKGSV